MLSEEIELAMSKTEELANKIPRRIVLIKQELSLCQHEENDIMHKIEMKKCNAYQGWVLFRDLQITLLKRRELKDELSALEGLLEKTKRKQVFAHHASQVVRSIRDRKRCNDARTYSVRVRKDFVDDAKFVIR